MIELIQKILLLIEYDALGKKEYYYIFLSKKLEQLNQPHDLGIIAKDMMPIFGGMGTFSDLVLHKNPFTPFVEENRELKNLRNQLFELCEDILGENNSNN
tara:strand:+ start:27369 stop:27668 length:300 start_codon:yes stop_codon:yes gene_type:complete